MSQFKPGDQIQEWPGYVQPRYHERPVEKEALDILNSILAGDPKGVKRLFYWKNTLQGADFWSDVYHKVIPIEIGIAMLHTIIEKS